MSSQDQAHFQQVDTGQAKVVKAQAGSIKKGDYCMLKGHPCKVSEYSTAMPGKHGSAKATIVGYDIFTKKKHEDACPTVASVVVPIVQKKEYQVADIGENDCVSLINDDGTLKEDLKLPKDDEEVYAQLMKVWEGKADNQTCLFTVIKACGKEKIIDAKIK